MKPNFILGSAAILLFALLSCRAGEPRTVTSFDADWRFLQADATSADQTQFDDSSWQQLNVPHDWSIAGPFAETNRTGGAGAFLPSGVVWYRKHFTLPQTDAERRAFI